MIKLDENLLQDIGLAQMPQADKGPFLRHIYETLEMRVGTRLAASMSDAQLTEFEAYINENNEQGAFQWLETNFPDYKQVVAEEFDRLKAEIQSVAPDILAAGSADQTPTSLPSSPQI